MPSSFKLEAYNTSGVRQATVTDFTWLSYTRRVNAPGLGQFGLSGSHSLLSTLADKWVIEFWRKPEGADWELELSSLYRDADWDYPESGQTFRAYCPGVAGVLDWREVAWAAGTANRSEFTAAKAETIAKTLVDYNIASNATTANGRERAGDLSYPTITVEADAAGGNTLTWYCAGERLLTTLQEIAKVGGGDWSLAKTTPTSYQFKWHSGQLGSDLTASIIFGLGFGNMQRPQYFERRAQERTVAIVAGQGKGADRDFVIETGPTYNATSNDIELWVNATDIKQGDTTGLQDRGSSMLEDKQNRATTEFRFEAIQSISTKYGQGTPPTGVLFWDLGDLVSAINPHTQVKTDHKIEAVTVGFASEGEEQISVEVREQ